MIDVFERTIFDETLEKVSVPSDVAEIAATLSQLAVAIERNILRGHGKVSVVPWELGFSLSWTRGAVHQVLFLVSVSPEGYPVRIIHHPDATNRQELMQVCTEMLKTLRIQHLLGMWSAVATIATKEREFWNENERQAQFGNTAISGCDLGIADHKCANCANKCLNHGE